MFRKTVLDNGLRILSETAPQFSSVSVLVLVGAGSRYESFDLWGASHFVEHLLFKGTLKYPTPKEISECIEGVGGILNAATDRESTIYWCKVDSSFFRRGADLLADMILHPRIESSEMEKERGVILEELNMVNDSPDSKADTLIDEILWPNQPMGREVAGSKESVQALSREALYSYMRQQYVPSNTVISVAGNVSHEEVVDAFGEALSAWGGRSAQPWQPVEEYRDMPRLKVEFRRTDQAHLCIGMQGLPAVHPDRYALDLLNVILGEGMSSRLFLELRENLGLVYEVNSSVSHYRDCGSLVVYCGVDPRRVDVAVETILGELKRIKEDLVEAELERALDLSKGRLMLRMEDTQVMAGWLGVQELLTEKVLTVAEVIDDLSSVTLQDLNRVANDLLVQDRLSMAVVGPYRSNKRFRVALKL